MEQLTEPAAGGRWRRPRDEAPRSTRGGWRIVAWAPSRTPSATAVFMPLFDLDELPGVLDPIPLWSARRPAPAHFREADHLPGGEGPLAGAHPRPRADSVGEAAERARAGCWPIRAISVSDSTRCRSVPPWRGGERARQRDRRGRQHAVAESGREYVLDARRAASERHVTGDLPEADARLSLPAHGADVRDLRHLGRTRDSTS